MTDLLTAAQMRAIEAAAIESGAVTGLELMERAGAGVVEAVLEEWPSLDTPSNLHGRSVFAKFARFLAKKRADVPRAGVLCGPGNNGGVGFVIAKLLADRGWNVEVFFLGPPSRQPPDAKTSGERWFRAYRRMHVIVTLGRRDDRLSSKHYDIFFDALFGTGLSGPLPEEVLELQKHINYEKNWQKNVLVAVDILSGLNADTGLEQSDLVMAADMTVTFHSAKLGHSKGQGPDLSGKVVIKDIGLIPYSVPAGNRPEA